MISPEITAKLLSSQRNEITEHFIYKKLAQSRKDRHSLTSAHKIIPRCINRTARDYQFQFYI